MRASVFVVCLAVAASLDAVPVAASPAPGQRGAEQTERITRTLRLGQNGQLIVSNIAGDITITASGSDDVTIEAVKRTTGPREELANVTVDIEERPGRVSVETEYRREPQSRRRRDMVAVTFTIGVPASASVDLRSISGTLQVTGVRGVVRAETVSGGIVTRQSPRIAVAKSMSGNVDVSDTDIEGDLSLGSVSGNIRGSGIRTRVVRVSTVSGDIELSGVVADRLNANSMSGTLQLAGALARNGRYTLNSHSGDVRLMLDTTVGFELTANSFSGDVQSDIPVTLGRRSDAPRRGRGSRRSVQATFGDGSAVLDVTTFSGDISITRR
jgi:DUF4097 and DUF4098 domain-containing protein YvlB